MLHNRGRRGGIRPWLLMLPVLCGLMLALGWGYHVLLGGEAMAVDLVIYTAIMILGFWAPGCFSGPFQGIKWVIPILVVVVLAGLIGVFTLWPPDNILFVDLSGANTWAQIPC